MARAPAALGLVLSVRAFAKRFGGVLANDSISLDVLPGEVHALLGENGAGKSTLVKCIYGFYRRDAGELLLDGEPRRSIPPTMPVPGHRHGVPEP